MHAGRVRQQLGGLRQRLLVAGGDPVQVVVLCLEHLAQHAAGTAFADHLARAPRIRLGAAAQCIDKQLAHGLPALEAQMLRQPHQGGGLHSGAGRDLAHRQHRHVLRMVEQVAGTALELRAEVGKAAAQQVQQCLQVVGRRWWRCGHWCPGPGRGGGIGRHGGSGFKDVTIVAQVRPPAHRVGAVAGGLTSAPAGIFTPDDTRPRHCHFATTPGRPHRIFLTRLTDRDLHSAP
ncbi:hypothetical protein CBM2599_A40043 [Cupriavidus taiwanensis]|nr:hypothetical protein CBM2599_A40043 [Cupriavidus taiwanensis]SOY89594.1 hypothetical protein CBM2600_A50044 [Cupriavidus taiwanensis]